ncbi:MAG: type II toxin-antitoxin system RatA family toxin [Rhodospirillales bacterium]|nr:type II toxin-antitoxin system RatA family toxin [Rhodospirillales bacterium]
MPTHAEKRRLPYSCEQIFDLVASVDRYPEFLPWCVASRIRRREGPNAFVADLVIGFKMVRERFTSRVGLTRPHRIDVTYHEGPFRYLTNHWMFAPDGEGGCIIDFYIDFEFRSRTLQTLMGPLFNEAVQRMVNAFEKRARSLYSIEAPQPRPITPLATPAGD